MTTLKTERKKIRKKKEGERERGERPWDGVMVKSFHESLVSWVLSLGAT